NLTVDLAPASIDYFLLGYNLESIELYRRLEGQSDYRLFRSIPVSASAQTRFQEQWTPTEADVGINEFAAFVKTRMPVVELEIAPNSITKVDVKCFSAGSLRVVALTPAAASCTDSWVGTASVVSRYPVFLTDDMTVTSRVTWTYDAAKLHYTPSGSFDLAFGPTPAENCTSSITPSTFTIVNDPARGESRLQIIDDQFNPPSYLITGGQFVDFTRSLSCPGKPVKVTAVKGFLLMYAGGSGLYTGQTRLSGSTDDGLVKSSWDFSRP
ncbi:hypothetical protein, partial [Deinococcus sp.]|uniref:hypothetical protein n=1 Tax=Deinococcus sp. TaxID=47478 RepID=UPI002869E722